jgi:hypothetical protein
MTDPDVEREIEANQERDAAGEREAEDDGPIIDTAERIIDPLVEPFVPNEVDNDDETLLNPEEAQRPD